MSFIEKKEEVIDGKKNISFIINVSNTKAQYLQEILETMDNYAMNKVLLAGIEKTYPGVYNRALHNIEIDIPLYQGIENNNTANITSVSTTINNTLNSVAGSAVLGLQGEQQVFDVISGSGFQVENISKTAYSGDIKARRDGCQYLVEVKNYTNVVANKEIHKFKRDIDSNPGINGGLFISIKTGISYLGSGKDSIKFERYNGIPIIYLVSSSSETIKSILGILHSIAQMYFIQDDNIVLERLNNINNILQDISHIRTSLVEARRNFDKSLDAIERNLLKSEIRLEDNLKEINKHINQEQSIVGGVENLIDVLSNNFSDSYYSKNETHQQVVDKVIDKITENVSQSDESFTITRNNKQININELYVLKPMKTKTFIHIKIERGTQINLGKFEYSNGYLVFDISEKNIDEIITFI